MSMKLEQAARQARIALQKCAHALGSYSHSDFRQRMGGIKEAESAMQSLDAVLAEQAEQEPVHWTQREIHPNERRAMEAQDYPFSFPPLSKAAMREVLAEQERKAKYDERFERLEKFEQAEPMTDTELINTNCRYTTPLMAEQAEQKPVGYFAYDEERDIWEELTGPNAPGATPLYAAPVQQVDLTDDEINQIINKNYRVLQLCRAVIAAYKEKNK